MLEFQEIESAFRTTKESCFNRGQDRRLRQKVRQLIFTIYLLSPSCSKILSIMIIGDNFHNIKSIIKQFKCTDQSIEHCSDPIVKTLLFMLTKIQKIINLKDPIFRYNSKLGHQGWIRPSQAYCFSVWDKIINHPYSRLCRYNAPIGCMLLYWPVTWGLAIGATTFPPISSLLLFFMGAWTSRSAGCIINDYFDRNFDKSVERTKQRPLASGQVSLSEAFKILFLNLCGGLYVLTQLPFPALLATFAILPIAALYPLAKRYTNYPQFVLGLAFNSGVIIGALTLSPYTLNWAPILLIYSAGISWTMVYDTVYAYQDIKDDKKLGLFSTAITWQKNPKQKLNIMLLCSFLFASSTALFDSSYLYCLPGFTLSYLYLFYQLTKLDIANREACGRFFRKNNYIGLLILLSLMSKGVWNETRNNI